MMHLSLLFSEEATH